MFGSLKAQLGFYRRLYRKKEGPRLLAYHLKQLSFKKPEKVRIVLCCNGVVAHGGLVDRLKGIVSMYATALHVGAEFYIQFTDPFLLSDYLMPNEVAWKTKDIRFNPMYDRIVHNIVYSEVPKANPLSWIKGNTPRTYFVYCNFDYLKLMHPDWPQREIRALWRTCFFQLFTYSTLLKAGLKALPQEKRIVCHTRFVGMLGDFNDIIDKRLDETEIEELFKLLDSRLEKVADDNLNVPVYVLSDSPRFLKHVEGVGVCKVLPGIPKHIDVKNKETNAEDHLKTFTDFVFIAESEAVYSVVIPPLYPSTFCKRAALIGEKRVHQIVE